MCSSESSTRGACPPTKIKKIVKIMPNYDKATNYIFKRGARGRGLLKFVILLVVGNQIKTWVIKTNTLGNGSSANPSNPNTTPIAKRLSMLFLFPILVGSPSFLSLSLYPCEFFFGYLDSLCGMCVCV